MSYYRVKLKRVSSPNKNLRTDEIEGYTEDLPSCGKGFVMFGRSLTPHNNVRVVATTFLVELSIYRDPDGRERRKFVTETSSSYELSILAGPLDGDFMDAVDALPPLQTAAG